MDEAIKIILDYGLLGVIAFFLGYYVFSQAKEIKALNAERIKDKDLEIQRKDKDSEQYIGIIEKSLNALTQVEKSMFESSTSMPIKLAEVIKKENEPLIQEIRKVLESKRNG